MAEIPKGIQEFMINKIFEFFNWDRIIVDVAIYQTKEEGWKISIYYKNKKAAIKPLISIFHVKNTTIRRLLEQLFYCGKKKENLDTDKKTKIENFKFFLLIKKKDDTIKLFPVNTKADTSKNKKQEECILDKLKKELNKLKKLSYSLLSNKLKKELNKLKKESHSIILDKLKEGLSFLFSFSTYDTKNEDLIGGRIFIFFTIKKDIIKNEKLELLEVIEGYLDSKELKSYIKQITGMKEQEFKEKLGYAIMYSQ